MNILRAASRPNRQVGPRFLAAALAAGLMILGAIFWFTATAVGKPESTPSAAAGAAALDPQKHFTILKIEPDVKREEVRIFFSHPLPHELLRYNLSLLPRLKINWQQSPVSKEGVLTLRGDFRYGMGYVVTLPEDLKFGERAYRQTVHTFFLPDRLPKVEFVEARSVIERDSRQLLHVRVQNVQRLLVEAIRVPPLLLPQALALESAPPEEWARALEALKAAGAELKPLIQGRAPFAPLLFEPFLEKQLFPAAGEKNQLLAVSLPLNFRKDREAGAIELIRVRDDQPESESGTGPRVLRLTDLALTYKQGDHSLLLWVTSLKSGNPVAGARVLAFTKDLEVFSLGAADPNGVFVFAPRKLEGFSLKTSGAFQPVKRLVNQADLRFLMAAVQDDVTYIAIQPQGNVKPGGVWQLKAGDHVRRFQGYAFTERGVYRPGEKVFFKGVIREYREGRILSPVGDTCRFAIISPKGERVFTEEARLSEFGAAAGEMTVQPHWPLGQYTLHLRYGPQAGAPDNHEDEAQDREDAAGRPPKNEVTATFQVQEFTPPRHFVALDFKRFARPLPDLVNRQLQGEFVRIGINGAYYAGGPVKHGQVRWQVHKSRTAYQAPGYAGYTFGFAGEEKGDLIESGQAILDEQGRAELEFPLESRMLTGQFGLLVVATVLDFDGRAASESRTFQVEPDILVGLSPLAQELQVGQTRELTIIAVEKGRQLRRGVIQAEVLEESWTYVAKRNQQGDLYWSDEQVWRKAYAAQLPLEKGQASFTFDAARGGRYLLTFTYKDAQGRDFASATAVQVAYEYYVDPEERREKPFQPLDLAADRQTYEPGGQAVVALFPKGPVAYYLVTLERQGVMEHQVLKAAAGRQPLEIPIREEHAPNVFLSVLGVTPRGEFPVFAGRYDTEAPAFVWGNLNLPVLRDPARLDVKISPEIKELKAEPGAEVALDFLVSADGRGLEAEMAVAVVDEAVLALTGFKTPTLASLTRFDLPLSVYTGELRALLVHQSPFYLSRIEPLTGGGGLSDDLVAKLRQRFEAVAYFNAALRTDGRGRARVSFTLPDNLTTYRVYVVAMDRGSRFASAERPLSAAKDFYLEPGLPAFFTRGDRFHFQVNAVNATTSAGPVKFSATGDGGLFLKPQAPAEELKAKGSLKLKVEGQAAEAGLAAARFAGEFQGMVDALELKLPINSGLVRETRVFFGSVKGAATLKEPLPPYLAAVPWDEVGYGEVQAVLTLAGSPFLRLSRAIRYLLHYPYGCIEQTSSGVLALAALRGVIKDGLVQEVSLEETDRYLEQGISRILSMQVHTGAFAYWPGQTHPHRWGSLYAAAALSLAQARGLAVPESNLNNTLDYLKWQIRQEQTLPSFKAFAGYILSLAGALDQEVYATISRDEKRLTREGRVLLLLAASQAGLKPQKDLQAALRAVLRQKEAPDAAVDDFQARFRSPALVLLAAQKIMPDDPLTKEAAAALLGGLNQQGIWTSTSDTGWALMAMGEHFKGFTFSPKPAQITVSQPGGLSQRLTLDPRGFRSLGLDAKAFLANPEVRVEGPKDQAWLYQLEVTAPRPDISEQGASQGFSVRKSIEAMDGSRDIRVGDVVKVTVFLNLADRSQRYVVLDDPLPAGLVAINTAFKTEAGAPEETDEVFDYLAPDGLIRFRPNFFEIRTDRVLAFRDWVAPGAYRFEYYARAVCEGEFIVPSTKAAAMYAPDVHGYSARGGLTVKER
jgi:alpha-2-macroglobulin